MTSDKTAPASNHSGRFSGVLGGKGYDEVFKVSPHLLEMQRKMGQIVAGYVAAGNRNTYMTMDLGCGTGRSMIPVLEASLKVFVVGVDNEQKMLDAAKRALDSKGLTRRYRLECADALSYLKAQERVECCDIVTTGWCFHNTEPEYRDKVWPEIHAVLRPGGLLVVADKMAVEDEEQHQRDLAEELIIVHKVFANSEHPEMAEAWEDHYREDDTRRVNACQFDDMICALGFTPLEVRMCERLDLLVAYIKN